MSDFNDGTSKLNLAENNNTLRPKAMLSKIDRSKTAPAEEYFQLIEGEDNDYYNSYNYYLFYYSQKNPNPRLPKPTYNKQTPDLDFIRCSNINDKKYEDKNEDKVDSNFSEENTSFNEKNEELSRIMGNLNLKEPNITNINSQNQSYSSNSKNSINQNYNLSDNYKLPNTNINTNASTYDYFRNQTYKVQTDEEDINSNFQGSFIQKDLLYGAELGRNIINSNYNFNNNYNQFNVNPNNYMNSFPNQNLNYNNNFYNNYNNNYNSNYNNNRTNTYINNNLNGINQNFNQMNSNYNSIPFNNFNNNSYCNNIMYNKPNVPTPSMNNIQYNNTYILQQQNYPPRVKEPYYQSQLEMNLKNNMMPMMGYNQNFQGFNMMNNYVQRIGNVNSQSFEINANVTEILGKLIELCKDHNGSRLIQKKYEEASEEDRVHMFDKIFPFVQKLSVDQFGNYVIQKLFECEDNIKRKKLIKQLEGIIFDLTLDTYGCRVVQKAIDVIELEDVRKVLNEIKRDVKRCIEDQNGNHAIQKLVEKLPKGEHFEILKFVNGKSVDLSTHQYGCRVIQRIFEFCSEEEKDKILNEILSRAIEVIQDQYGNYVIQHIIEKRGAENCSRIFQILTGKIFDFSVHKFASNVIEKCLSIGTYSQRKVITEEVLSKDDNESLLGMVKDKYGNYVVQKMIEFSNQKTKELIIKKICTSQALKKRDGFSKHVINFIEKMGFPTPGSAAFLQQFGK